jgi:hypothetical protein
MWPNIKSWPDDARHSSNQQNLRSSGCAGNSTRHLIELHYVSIQQPTQRIPKDPIFTLVISTTHRHHYPSFLFERTGCRSSRDSQKSWLVFSPQINDFVWGERWTLSFLASSISDGFHRHCHSKCLKTSSQESPTNLSTTLVKRQGWVTHSCLTSVHLSFGQPSLVFLHIRFVQIVFGVISSSNHSKPLSKHNIKSYGRSSSHLEIVLVMHDNKDQGWFCLI